MTDLRLMPPLGCENDVGGRFTVCPSAGFTRDPLRIRRGGSVLRLQLPGRTWPDGQLQAEMGATPPADALVMAWAGAGFHKPCTAPGGGRSRYNDPWREGRRADQGAQGYNYLS